MKNFTDNRFVSNSVGNFQSFLFFSAIFLLLMSLLTAYIIVPKIYEKDLEERIISQEQNHSLQVELLTRYLENQVSVLNDLASLPIIVNASMTASRSDPELIYILDNYNVKNAKAFLILQDVIGNVLQHTEGSVRQMYGEEIPWSELILEGVTQFDFQIIAVDKEEFTYKLSVPVVYKNGIEGILSGEFRIQLKDIFLFPENIPFAVKITQKDFFVVSDLSQVIIPQETESSINKFNLTLTSISDQSDALKASEQLERLIYTILLSGFVFAFVLFVFVGYRSLMISNNIDTSDNVNRISYLFPAIMLVLGVTASILASSFYQQQLEETERQQLLFEFKDNQQIVLNELNLYISLIDSLKNFYSASSPVDREEFNTFVKQKSLAYPQIQAFEWVPKVSNDRRKAYEFNARLDGMLDFKFSNIIDGQSITAKEQDVYYPIYYVYPLEGNEVALGYDLASNNERKVAIDKAIVNHRKVISQPVNLVQANQNGFLVFNPVYEEVIDGVKTKENFIGLVLLVFKSEDIIKKALGSRLEHFSVTMNDVTDIDNKQFILDIGETDQSLEQYEYKEVIDILDRRWEIIFTPYPSMLQEEGFSHYWLIILGSLFTLFITYQFLQIIRQRHIVEEQVKQRSQELIDSEEQFRAVVEGAVDGLITINRFGIILKVNQAVTSIFGYLEHELIGKNIKILMPEPYKKEHDGYLNNYLQTGDNQIIGVGREVKGLRKNGDVFPLDLSVSEITLDGEKHFSGVIRDITKRKERESEREQMIEQLTENNEQLDRFAYICSHDLKEPLRMISSFSDLLENHLSESLKDDEKGKKYFHYVTDGAIRAQQLISDILDYSRVDKDTEKPEEIDLQKIAETVKGNLVNELGHDSDQLQFSSLPIVIGHRTQLYQLIQNLVNNGLKYHAEDVVPQVQLKCVDLGNMWEISVKDNGIGIKEDYQKKIFEVFQRLHRKEEYNGTGIGLAICQKVVQRHGGKIWVESTLGEGSTFYFTLPKFVL